VTAGRDFGEDGGRLSYGGYLRLDALLAQQQPQSGDSAVSAAHDELLFITIHQVYELWFKLLLHELTTVRDLLLHREIPGIYGGDPLCTGDNVSGKTVWL